MLVTEVYRIWALSIQNEVLEFTDWCEGGTFTHNLNSMETQANFKFAPPAKELLAKIKPGSQFLLRWGYNGGSQNLLRMYWIGTTWTIPGGFELEFQHKGWTLTRMAKNAIVSSTQEIVGKILIEGLELSNQSTVTSSTPEDAIKKQLKGKNFRTKFDGDTAEVLNESNTQVYYIGPNNELTITYKANLNKDGTVKQNGTGITQSLAGSSPPSTNVISSNSTSSSTSIESGSNDLAYPFARRYPRTSPYGWRIHPISGKRKFHHGVDIGAPLGTPVLASTSGNVLVAKYLRGYGNTVTIFHNNYITLYAHLSEINVAPGKLVSKGDVIGKCGSTGNSTGPHLHFEVKPRDSTNNFVKTVDPCPLLKASYDRLRKN